MVKKGRKKKTKTIAQELNHVAERVQKLVRLKAADDNGYVHCFDGCGHVDNWRYMQGGHFMSRRYTATKIMEENIHPQSPKCNMLMSKGDQRVYEGFRLAMVETYGEDFIQDLVEMTRQTKKWSRFELEDILKDVNEQIKFHENRLGGL
jgi:hypothetical protein